MCGTRFCRHDGGGAGKSDKTFLTGTADTVRKVVARAAGSVRGLGPQRGRSMTRWNAGLAAVAMLMAGLTGCRQQCFMTQADFNQSQNSVSLTPSGLPRAGRRRARR